MSFDKYVCTLFSSSRGNSVYIKNGKEEYLIDAGVSARMLETSLSGIGTSLKNISAIFVTHEHSDHVRGLDVICRHHNIPVYAPEQSCRLMESCASIAECLCPMEQNGVVYCGDTCFSSFTTPHDSVASCGYTVDLGSFKFGLATDIGYITKHAAAALTGCKAVVFESNHDIDMLKNSSYPENVKQRILGNFGHLSNEKCASFLPYLIKNGTSNIVLAHLSPENNTPALAFDTSFKMLTANGIEVCTASTPGDVSLAVAGKCEKQEVIAV